jgi:hypothetical protein
MRRRHGELDRFANKRRTLHAEKYNKSNNFYQSHKQQVKMKFELQIALGEDDFSIFSST